MSKCKTCITWGEKKFILYLSNWIKENSYWFKPGPHFRDQFDLSWWILVNVWSCCCRSSAGYQLVWHVSVTDTLGALGLLVVRPATTVHRQDPGEISSTKSWTPLWHLELKSQDAKYSTSFKHKIENSVIFVLFWRKN